MVVSVAALLISLGLAWAAFRRVREEELADEREKRHVFLVVCGLICFIGFFFTGAILFCQMGASVMAHRLFGDSASLFSSLSASGSVFDIKEDLPLCVVGEGSCYVSAPTSETFLGGYLAQRGDGDFNVTGISDPRALGDNTAEQFPAQWTIDQPAWSQTIVIKGGHWTPPDTQTKARLKAGLRIPTQITRPIRITGFLSMPALFPKSAGTSTFINVEETVRSEPLAIMVLHPTFKTATSIWRRIIDTFLLAWAIHSALATAYFLGLSEILQLKVEY